MRGHPAGILEAALGREVGRGLGQEHEHERYEDQGGQRAHDEHGVPREVGQHPDRKRCGEHGTHVVAGHHDRGGVGAAAGAGELGDHGDAGGQATAQAQAREEAQDAEPQDGRGERGGEREHREYDHGADEHLAPAPAVREVAHAQGADHHAEQTGGRDRGGLTGGHLPHAWSASRAGMTAPSTTASKPSRDEMWGAESMPPDLTRAACPPCASWCPGSGRAARPRSGP